MRRLTLVQSLAVVALVSSWATPAAAQSSACINDSLKKACLQLTAQPDAVVQASKLDGVRDTFVYYTASLTGIDTPNSTRNVAVDFTLTPATAFVDLVETPANGHCSVSGATVSCVFDKLDALNPITLKLTATAPQYAGAATPATFVNSAVFGWNGKTGTVSKSLAVSTNGGYSWVPPNTTVALVTSAEASDPSLQTSPENPVWAKMIIPGRSTGFMAYFALNNNANEDFSEACTAGLFVSGNSDGGPYVCRDITVVGAPVDAGNPRRWVEAAIDPSVDGSFTDTPVQIVFIWDDSIVPATQLPPSPITPNGTPNLAVFYRAAEADDPIRAFGNACGANAPPCVNGVQVYGTNDWTATLNVSLLDNGGQEADPTIPPAVTDLLARLMNELVNIANALGLPPPIIIR